MNSMHSVSQQKQQRYCPYRHYRYFLPVTVIGVILSLVISVDLLVSPGNLTTEHIQKALVFLMFGAVCVFACVQMYTMSRQAISCTPEGISFYNDGKQQSYYIAWNEGVYVYKTSNTQGHTYYVFSRRELSADDARKIANRSCWALKTHIGNESVIYENGTQSSKVFFEMVSLYSQV